MSKPAVICLTPVKNEAWILGRFLECASLWADHIVIADQGSDDGSRDIALSFKKVMLVDNRSPAFDPVAMRKILLEAARRIPGQRLLIALDADEVLTANVSESSEWKGALEARPGTVIRLPWVNVSADVRFYSTWSESKSFGFMDDGTDYTGRIIHEQRIPVPQGAPWVALSEVKVMHYAMTDLERVRSRIRWYQCWERLNQPHLGPIEIYRTYNDCFFIPAQEMKPIPIEWMLRYERHGMNMTNITRDGVYHWDKEVLSLFSEYGLKQFKKLFIWDVDWSKLYRKIYGKESSIELEDPRKAFDKYVHRWLERTQPYCSRFSKSQSALWRIYLLFIQNTLRAFGW